METIGSFDGWVDIGDADAIVLPWGRSFASFTFTSFVEDQNYDQAKSEN